MSPVWLRILSSGHRFHGTTVESSLETTTAEAFTASLCFFREIAKYCKDGKGTSLKLKQYFATMSILAVISHTKKNASSTFHGAQGHQLVFPLSAATVNCRDKCSLLTLLSSSGAMADRDVSDFAISSAAVVVWLIHILASN